MSDLKRKRQSADVVIVGEYIHSRDMKNQHIKFEILKKDCVYSIANFYNIILYSICFRLVKFVKKIFIRLVMSWMTSLKVWMLATGKILN